jgi:hypothetical protein
MIDFILSGLKSPEPSAYIIFLLFILLTAHIKKLIWVLPVPFLPVIPIRLPNSDLLQSTLSRLGIPVLYM